MNIFEILRKIKRRGVFGTAKVSVRILRNLPYQISESMKHKIFLELHPELKEADKIRTSVMPNEKRKLFYLASEVVDGFALEVGSYLGASACFISAGLKLNSKLICVDTWMNDAMNEEKRDTYNEFLRNTYAFRHKIITIRNFSCKAVEKIRDITNGKIDLLFIDGDHSYEGCKNDFELFFPLLKSGGYVIFHDWGWAEGVQKVIREFAIPSISSWSSLPNMFYGKKR